MTTHTDRATWFLERGRRARRRLRRLYERDDRVHLRLTVDLDGGDELAATRIERALERVPGVAWARVNTRLGCVVVQRDASVADDAELDAALHAAQRAPRRRREPVTHRHPERHPGDIGPVVRTAVELAAEVASIGLGGLLRRLGVKPIPLEIDLAAVIELASGLPQVRDAIEKATSIARVELALELARAAVAALLQSEVGPAVGTVRRALRLRELAARRALWQRIEPELCAEPDDLGGARARIRRPSPTPMGPIERHTETATPASLGAFVASAVAARNLAGAAGSIFAGVPKPARYGRDAFASHLGYRLARAGVLVIEPQVLRKLDRLDCVVIDSRVVDDALLAAARAAELRVELSHSEAYPHDAALGLVRALRDDDHGVCAIGLGTWPGLDAADCAVAIAAEGAAPAWHADILCPRPHLARAVVDSLAAARRASHEGVRLAQLEAGLGAALGIGGLGAATTRRIMVASSAASILAIANGVRHAHRIELEAPAGSRAPDATPWHELSVDDALSRLAATRRGLTDAQADARRRPRRKPPSAVSHFTGMVVEELATPVAPVLAAGAGLSMLTGAFADAALIGAVIGVNGVIGGAQRYRADRSLAALSARDRRLARVRRSGAVVELDGERLVPGDVIELAAGDVVSADCRVIEAHGLEADESSLTGESLPVAKRARPTSATAVAERSSMVYDGTAIAAGRGVAVVVAVGDDTEARRAYAANAEAPRAVTGVEARLESLTAYAGPLAGASGLVVAASSLLRGRPIGEAIGASVSLAVAAVPEGLPLVATMAQLAAADRLSRRGALVREPRAVEALGRVDVLCADKTGTLTEGKIRLGLVSDGHDERPLDQLEPRHRRVLSAALRASPSTNRGDAIPHLTDRALVEGARRAGVGSHDELNGWQRLHELPFEPSRGFHAGLAEHEGGNLLSVKGAPEVLLPWCTYASGNGAGADRLLTDGDRVAIASEAIALARRGYRVLAVAERDADTTAPVDNDRLHDLHFRGFVAFSDPVRLTARDAVAKLRRAGVDVLMVTGDHPSTARAIAAELGLPDRRVLTGPELDELDDAALDAELPGVGVLARVTPAHKVRIVAALQRAGRVVAMTGDGANDAPAIRMAHVGIALGANSTAAARDAADLIVTDERIETIVDAALEGRALWTSVRDAVAILVGGNVGEILFTLAGGLVTGASPLNARQLLLVNLITDTLPALAIALRPPRETSPEQLLHEGPDASLGDALTSDIAWRAAITAGAATLGWTAARLTGTRARASTVAMLSLTGSQLAQTLLLGTHSKSVVATSLGSLAAVVGVVQTPGLSRFFGCRPLGPLGLAQAGLATAAGAAAALLSLRAGSAASTPSSRGPAAAASRGLRSIHRRLRRQPG